MRNKPNKVKEENFELQFLIAAISSHSGINFALPEPFCSLFCCRKVPESVF